MLLKKTLIAFLALFVLSGCNTTKKSLQQDKEVAHIEENSLVYDFESNIGNKVFFAFNKSDLSHEAKEQLNKQGTWLKKHSNMKATIEGHCDDRGTREYNLALGEKRAETVLQYFRSLGIEDNRLDTISYGKEKPAVIDCGEIAWSQNRRAVTSIK